MSKTLTIGSCTFQYPEQGTKAGWGEEATCWACAITTKVNSISGTNDIDLKTICIVNNKSVATNVGTGACTLSFSTSAVRSFEATYVVIRTDSCCVILTESGTMTGNYNGTACNKWNFSIEHVGCAGMCFTMTCAGQVQYFSDACAGAGTMKFKASTIAQ